MNASNTAQIVTKEETELLLRPLSENIESSWGTEVKDPSEIIADLTGDDLTNFEPEAGKAYIGLPNELYHSLKDWESSSTLKNIERSLEYHEYQKTQPAKPSLAKERGSAFHYAMELLAETDSLEGFEYFVKTFKGSTIPSKKYTEVKNNCPEYIVIPEDTKESVIEMANKAYKIGRGKDLFHRCEGIYYCTLEEQEDLLSTLKAIVSSD